MTKNILLKLDDADMHRARQRKLDAEQGLEKDLTWEDFFIMLVTSK